MERNKNVVSWDSQTAITKPDEQGVDDVDEEDSADEQKMEKSSIFCVENTIFSETPNPIFFSKKMISHLLTSTSSLDSFCLCHTTRVNVTLTCSCFIVTSSVIVAVSVFLSRVSDSNMASVWSFLPCSNQVQKSCIPDRMSRPAEFSKTCSGPPGEGIGTKKGENFFS